MRRAILPLLSLTLLSFGAVATPTPAQAQGVTRYIRCSALKGEMKAETGAEMQYAITYCRELGGHVTGIRISH